MEDVLKAAEQVAGKIKESRIHKEFIEARDEINNNPALKSKIMEFKKASFEYQYKKMNNINHSLDEEKRVSSMYHTLLLNKDAKSFLESEKRLVEMLDKIYNIISSSCEIEMFM